MQTHATASKPAARRQRPKTLTVFAAAFAAGAVLAYGVDRMVDVHVVRVMPQVESEPIFVALRSLPQGSPVTVWDVALKDWPKAMLPTTALKADASFEGMVLRHPVREGQPLLSVQLVRDGGPLPGATVAALPAAARTVDAGRVSTATATNAVIGEPFVPATPAEPAATTVSVADPQPTVREPQPAPATEPGAASTAAATVVAESVAAAEPRADPGSSLQAGHPTTDDTTAIVAVVPPRSTDVDEPGSVQADAAPVEPSATAPGAVATPAVTDVAAAEQVPAPAVPWQSATPVPTVPTTADDIVATPLAAPVPALPSTDIERPLARFGHAHPAPVHSPAALATQPVLSATQPVLSATQPALPAEQPASVLDRTTEAELPAPGQAAPRLHLVVPERIALAADASFAQPKPLPAAQPESAQPQPIAQPNEVTRAAEAAGGNLAADAPQRRATARKPAATNPAPRKQPGPRQPSAKAPPPQQHRVANAWLPTFLGGSRQR
ncbi:MAG: SAF domain-containing protein [Planctomycetaceae bacterium]